LARERSLIKQARVASATFGTLLVVAIPPAAASDHDHPNAVAVISALRGNVTAVPDGRSAHVARRSEWLAPGTLLKSRETATVEITFADGSRYEIRGRLDARIRETDVVVRSGALQPLERLPELPLVFPLKQGASAARPTAVRIREPAGDRPYPAGGVATLADAVSLDVNPDTCKHWDVVVEDAV
jgi:hypothetical protein